MNKFIATGVLVICGLIGACGGGGGGEGSGDPPPPTQPTNFTVQLSTSQTSNSLLSGNIIKDVYAVIRIPENVTVKTTNGVPDVVPVPGAELRIPPSITGNELTVDVSSTTESGISPNTVYASVSCSYTGATMPAFTQPTTFLVAGGPPENFLDYFDLLMDVVLTAE